MRNSFLNGGPLLPGESLDSNGNFCRQPSSAPKSAGTLVAATTTAAAAAVASVASVTAAVDEPPPTAYVLRPRKRASSAAGSQQSLKSQNLIQSVKKSLAKTKRQWDRSGFIHVIYVLVLLAYSLLGGGVFMALDGQYTDRTLAAYRRRCMDVREDVWTNLSLECGERSFADCRNLTRTALERLDDCLRAWPSLSFDYSTADYCNALIYAITVYTTIGYGNISVLSKQGRMAMIVYAMIGIPLFFAFLNDMGQWFHFKFLRLYHWTRRRWRGSWLRGRLCQLTCLATRRRKTTSASTVSDSAAESERRRSEEESGNDGLIFLFAVGVLIVYLVIVCLLFMVIGRGRWSFFESFYFLFQSISLIGFGDVFPDDPNFLLINTTFIIVGIIFLSVCFFVLQEWIRGKTYRLSSKFRHSVRRWRRHRHRANNAAHARNRGGKLSRAGSSLPRFVINGAGRPAAGHRLARIDDSPTLLTRSPADVQRRRRVVRSADESLLGQHSRHDEESGRTTNSTGLKRFFRRHTVVCMSLPTLDETVRQPDDGDDDQSPTEPRRKKASAPSGRFGKFQCPAPERQASVSSNDEYEDDDEEQPQDVVL